MNAAAPPRFDPPAQGGWPRALALALLAHLLLILALTWGLHWKNQPQDMAVEAELWSPAPQHAAPPPPPPPPPQPHPVAPEPPPPVVDDSQREAEIALAQQKKREEEQRRLAQAREEQRRQEQLRQQQEQQRQQARQQRQQQLAAEQKRRQEQQLAEQKADEARRAQVIRQMQLQAIRPDSSMGSAAREAGPSGDYAAQIRAAVRRNIVFTGELPPGNPAAEVQVITDPAGLITSRRITQSSGVKAWDDAVLRALDRTARLPSDKGRYWNPMLITFRIRD